MSKIYKYLLFTFIFSSLFGIFVYSLLNNRHKAIVKTFLLHNLHIVDNNWNFENDSHTFKMLTPTFLIDGIYKSMEGPKSTRLIQLNSSDDIFFITGYTIIAVDADTNKEISREFICHMNVDLDEENYYNTFGLQDRLHKQYPRLTSLSSGFENFKYDKGFGVPIKGNEYLFVVSESLNHNIIPISKKVKHLITIEYEPYNGTQIPLMCKNAFIQLPFNKYDPFKQPLDPKSNQCVPIETKNHTYQDSLGNPLSGHWVVPKGKNTYKSSIDSQLQIPKNDSIRLHYAGIHVHPFATSICLYDATTKQIIFKSNIYNYKNKIGLEKAEGLSSKEGIWLYGNHYYELVLEVDNTTEIDQDMMGCMFLYFYDKELDEKLKTNSF